MLSKKKRTMHLDQKSKLDFSIRSILSTPFLYILHSANKFQADIAQSYRDVTQIEGRKKERKEEEEERRGTYHVGVSHCRGDRRRRRPPPRGGGYRVGDDTNTRRTRDGSAPCQSCRARQIAHVHSTLFNPSMSALPACEPTYPLSAWRSEPTCRTLFRDDLK